VCPRSARSDGGPRSAEFAYLVDSKKCHLAVCGEELAIALVEPAAATGSAVIEHIGGFVQQPRQSCDVYAVIDRPPVPVCGENLAVGGHSELRRW
jgi:hypothetical protein